MKLNELRTITPADLTPKNSSEFNQPKDSDKVGSGLFASTYINPDTPFDATKIVHYVRDNNLKKDAYFTYVSALAKNDRISNNPYFPRIYAVKVTTDGFGRIQYSVEMEALLDFETLSVEELKMLGEKMFFNFHDFVKDVYARFKGLYSMKSYELYVASVLRSISLAMMHNSVATYIKDPKLRQAMLILRSIVKQGTNSDIHAGNVMVRRGPGGPHLVITDPVS